MTKEEIILETVNYYSEDPKGRRGIESSNNYCLYFTTDKKMCAFGRVLKNPEDFEDDAGSSVKDLSKMFTLNEIVKPEYTGHSVDFWQDLQDFHDDPFNWDIEENTISESGELRVKELLNRYAN